MYVVEGERWKGEGYRWLLGKEEGDGVRKITGEVTNFTIFRFNRL